MSLTRRIKLTLTSAAFWAVTMVTLACMAVGALGLITAALVIWLSHFLGMAAAMAIAGGVLSIGALFAAGSARVVLRRMRANQPSLAAEAIGQFSLAMRLCSLIIRRDPAKMLLAAMLAGALAEYFSPRRPPEDS